MSCDDAEVDCTEVLDRVYAFLDREMDDDHTLTYQEIERHLNDCGGCLSKYDLERAIRALLVRSCGCDHAPEELRMKVLSRIRAVRVQTTDW